MKRIKDIFIEEMVNQSQRAELHWMEQEYYYYRNKKKHNVAHPGWKKMAKRRPPREDD